MFFPLCWRACLIGSRQYFDVQTDRFGPEDMRTIRTMCVRNYPGGIPSLAGACKPLLGHPSGKQVYYFVNAKFDNGNGFGPTCVRRFVEDSKILGERTADQWQQDAFGQVDEWLRQLGLRP